MDKKQGCLYEFGSFYLDTNEYRLLHGQKVVPLSPKVLETLLVLVRNSGHVVTKDELMGAVWPGTFVEESSLTQNISILRKALREGNEEPCIETVTKRGYRFIAPVRVLNGVNIDPGSGELVLQERTATKVIIQDSEEFDGEEKEESPTGSLLAFSSSPARLHLKRRFMALGLVSLLFSGAVGGYLWNRARVGKTSSQSINSVRSVRSLAILPLRQLGNESDNEYLGLGMADALIVKFSRFQQLSVLPTSTIIRYAGQSPDALTVGRELGVEAILEGTVQRDGERCRVTVMLINVSDGRTLWSDKYDERFTDLFELQDSISGRVADTLSLRLTGEEKQLLAKHSTDNLEAYEAYLTGLYFWHKRTKDALQRAVKFFQQAIELDPNYAPAYAGLGDSYNLNAYYGYDKSPDESYSKAKRLALKALEIDSTLAEAYTTLGMLSSAYERNTEKAEELYRKAIEQNPNYGTVRVRYAWHSLGLGNVEIALREMKKAQELDPVSPLTNASLGLIFYYQHNYDEAIRFSRKALELEPTYFMAQYNISLSYAQKGMHEEAITEGKKLRAMATNNSDVADALDALGYIFAKAGHKDEALKIIDELQTLLRNTGANAPPVNLVMIYEALGERDKALFLLKQSLDAGATLPLTFRLDPRSELLIADPRYQELVRIQTSPR